MDTLKPIVPSSSSKSIYFPLLPSIFSKVNKKKKKKEAEPQGQVLAKRTCSGVIQDNEKTNCTDFSKNKRPLQAYTGRPFSKK